MSAHMREIQDALPAGSPVKLVSFTTDPDFDTPAVLKKYAARFGARDGQWIFLTGGKAALRHATVEGLKLGVVDKPPGERDNADDLFIHSQKLVLIDQSGRIRGYFDGETADGRRSPGRRQNPGPPMKPTRAAMTLRDLPAINATLNGLSAVFLGAGFVFIKKKNVPAHRACMISAFITSVLFLACYLTYHYLLSSRCTVFKIPPGFVRFIWPSWSPTPSWRWSSCR